MSDTACLLLHGIAGSPFEMEPLVPALKELGCAVDLPTLPGHDSSLEDFRRTFFKDWMGCAEERYQYLSRRYKKVIPIGFSMGGSLALLLSARHSPAAVVSLAGPLCLCRLFPFSSKTLLYLLMPLLKHLRPVLSRPGPKPQSRDIAPYRGYEGVTCLPQMHSLAKGLAQLRRVLPDIRCPALIMHDARDRTSWPGSALGIAAGASSEDLTVIYTRIREQVTSRHMLTTHRETREYIAAKVSGFVDAINREEGTS
jgi:Esterase/lipase